MTAWVTSRLPLHSHDDLLPLIFAAAKFARNFCFLRKVAGGFPLFITRIFHIKLFKRNRLYEIPENLIRSGMPQACQAAWLGGICLEHNSRFSAVTLEGRMSCDGHQQGLQHTTRTAKSTKIFRSFGGFPMNEITYSIGVSMGTEALMITLFNNDLNLYRLLIFFVASIVVMHIFKYMKNANTHD